MGKRAKVLLGLCAILVLSIPPFSVYILYHHRINFLPPDFVEEYLKFLGSLTAVLLAFYLVNIYWAKRKGSVRAAQMRHLCIVLFNQISDLLAKASSALSEKHRRGDESSDRDGRLLGYFSRLQESQQQVLGLLREHGAAIALDQQLEQELITYTRTVSPAIQELSYLRRSEDIRLNEGRVIEIVGIVQKAVTSAKREI